MIIELSIFNKGYFSKLKAKEDALLKAEQHLSFIKAKIKTIQELLPKLSDNSVWYTAYLELETLQVEEFVTNAKKNSIWAEMKALMTETERAPDCPVLEIIR